MAADEAGGDADRDLAVEIDEASHVATVEIRRGPHNFLNVATLGRVADVLDRLAGRDFAGGGDVRAVVLCSEGKNFCAGADFGGGGTASGIGDSGGPHLYDVAIRLFEQPLPLVAAVQGAAIGGGLGLALAADFRVATPRSRFAANFSLLGFHQGFGISVTLPLVVGRQAALDLLYTGRRVDGAAAREIGLCDHLVEPGELRPRALRVAADIAAAGPLATRAIRQTMRGDLAAQVKAAMAHEKAVQGRLRQTADFREGVAAVAARRPANFTGR